MATIANLSFSKSGGSGEVARLLTEAELLMGHNSKHLHEIEKTLRSEPFRKPTTTLAAMADEIFIKQQKFPEMFSFFRELSGTRTAASLETFEIVHLHWTPGLIRVSELLRLPRNKKLIVSLHDMYFATGGCHYTMGCAEHLNGCKACPQVQAIPGLRKRIGEQRTLKDKLLERADLITTPSTWMKKKVQKSNPNSDWVDNVYVVGNPNPMGEITGDPHWHARRESETTVFLIVATDLSNPNKNVLQVCEALLRRQSTREEIWLVGSRGEAFESLGAKVKYFGPKARSELTNMYGNVSFLVSGTTEEAFGLSILEAATFGVPAIVKSGSGSDEFAAKHQSGFIFTQFSELTSMSLPSHSSTQYEKLSLNGIAGSRSHNPIAIATNILELVNKV